MIASLMNMGRSYCPTLTKKSDITFFPAQPPKSVAQECSMSSYILSGLKSVALAIGQLIGIQACYPNEQKLTPAPDQKVKPEKLIPAPKQEGKPEKLPLPPRPNLEFVHSATNLATGKGMEKNGQPIGVWKFMPLYGGKSYTHDYGSPPTIADIEDAVEIQKKRLFCIDQTKDTLNYLAEARILDNLLLALSKAKES